MGLTKEAQDYLNTIKTESKPYDIVEGLCPGEEYSLYMHKIESDSCPGVYEEVVLREVVQCCPWSSGPVIFLCLEDDYGIRSFQWSRDDVKKYT